MIGPKDGFFLGYEVGTGEEVYAAKSHMVITGITRSGKTTTIDSIVKDSKMRAILFKTKIGEKELQNGMVVPPFFRQKSDWQYVQTLLEASLKERLKFERAWIIEVTQGTSDLHEVKRNLERKLADEKVRGLSRNVYMTLNAYMENIIPEIDANEFSSELNLVEGMNIMDVISFSDELQSLVIQSVLEDVLRNHVGTLVVMPEMWKFIPQKTGNPVKSSAEAFIRQGATNENFFIGDSQDLAGVDKSVLKQVRTWILGLQLEINEVEHSLDQIPLPSKEKPRPEEIMTLKTGHFFVCTPDGMTKIYVKPLWMDAEKAKKIALGKINIDSIMKPAGNTTLPPSEELRIIRRIVDDITPQLAAMEARITKNILSKVQDVRTYSLAPMEKIEKDFLEAEKNHILTEASHLSDMQRKILKFIEIHKVGTNCTEVLDRVFHLPVTTVSNRQSVNEAFRGLSYTNMIRLDEKDRAYPNLIILLKDRLGKYNATEAEILLVYNHIMARV